MAISLDSLDYLDPGCEIRIVTSLKNEIVGVVVVCAQRMILLKTRRPDQPPDTHDLRLINMDHVTDCNMIKKAETDEDQFSSLATETAYIDLTKLQNRLKQKMAERSQRNVPGNLHPN